MTSCREAFGRPVLSRSGAEEMGAVRRFVVDPNAQRIVAVVVRHGRSDELVAWDQIAAFGPDAVLVERPESLRQATSDDERADLAGRRDPIGKRLLNDQGNGAGEVVDAEFDAETGAVQSIVADDASVDAHRIRGIGSYAVVVAASDEARSLLG